MSTRRRIISLVTALCLALTAIFASAQALPNLSVARVRYNTLKSTAAIDALLKPQIDALDRDLAEASRFGRNGEVRRLLAKGTALLGGRPWTDLDDFDTSLVLRSDRVFVDSDAPWTVRLEQIYAPAIELTGPLTVRAAVRLLLSTPAGTPDARELARVGDVGRDLRESPLQLELKLDGLEDGPYVLDVEVLDGSRALGTASLRTWLLGQLDERTRALAAAAQALPDSVRADVLYPIDYIGKVNRGRVEIGPFNLPEALDAAEGVAAAAKGAVNPLAERTGDFTRHYLLDAAQEILPYRVLVPKTYAASRAYPLVMALHGLGATEDSFFEGYQRRVPQLAEARGYLVAAPLGYRVDGFYGSGIGATTDPGVRRARELSEQDVMEVLRRMRSDYNVDERRIYLLGHSMGAIGTWHLAAKYPSVWAAVAPFSGLGDPASVARMQQIPQLVVHGDADPTVPVRGSRAMVAEMHKLGVDVTYIEVPGGNHNDMVAPNLEAAFDFFDKKRKPAQPSQQR